MADFGDLNEFLDDVDVQFSFAGKDYNVTFPFKNVAALKAWQAEYETRVKADTVTPAERRASTYLAAAKLFGGRFDIDKWEFTHLPKDHFIPQLIADGASYTLIDRLVSGIWAKYQWGDDIAVSFVKTYDLGKALEAVATRSAENTAPETPKEPGETSADDSETSEG